MSSTNRGYDRHKSDYYVTPIDKIIDFLEAFAERERVTRLITDISSITPNGKIDSIEYAHFVWQKGYRPEFTQLAVI